jgi:hypothetical protein
MVKIFAEREGERRHLATAPDLDSAAEYVEAREADGTWPEGHDALGQLPDRSWWMYVDGWEPVDLGR